MKKMDSLVGASVKVFVDGYIAEGILEQIDEDKIFLYSLDGSYILIYKNKISMVVLNFANNEKQQQEPSASVRYNDETHQIPHQQSKVQKKTYAEMNILKEEVDEYFTQNGIAENNQYGSIKPGVLLEQQPKNPIEESDLDYFNRTNSNKYKYDNEFSISVGLLQNEAALLNRSERMKILQEEREAQKNGSKE